MLDGFAILGTWKEVSFIWVLWRNRFAHAPQRPATAHNSGFTQALRASAKPRAVVRHSKSSNTTKKSTMDITWREFEKLVAKLENALSPIGATIKSPDKLKDAVTGQIREVDGSIRFKTTDKEILITIECRKRNQKQDITWIEQLTTKKKNINADRTIAVSIKGFSKAAHKLAEQNDITLKTLNEINPVMIVEWLIPKSIVNLFRAIKLIFLSATYNYNGEFITFSTNKLEEQCFFDRNKRMVPIPMILGSIEDYLTANRPDILFSPALDGTSKDEIIVSNEVNENEFFIKIDDAFYSIKGFCSQIELCYMHTITNMEQGQHYIYDSDKNKFQVSQFDSTNEKLPFTFRHLADTKNKKLIASFELKKPN